MTMAVDNRPQHHLGMGHYQQPHFTNPWQPTTSANSAAYNSSYSQPSPSMEAPPSKASSLSMGYTANPAASSLGSDLVPTRSYGSYGSTSAPSSHPSYTPTTASQYPQDQQATVGPYGYDADALRRSSYQPMSTTRASVSDEIASARGMVAMAHQDPIGRANSYPIPATTRSGSESYPYPQTHSQHSSISSASTYPYYSGSYTGSLDGSSVTDYSSASEDAMGQRTLPAPNQLIHGFPPNPETMMNQFNAKMSPSAQKKHKCKICDKRFTRPSSLQTHMYSHTGEKPFACDHDGCGRHFSVVSNLRRHKKVHKGEVDGPSDGDD